jgi:hypothetical protein
MSKDSVPVTPPFRATVPIGDSAVNDSPTLYPVGCALVAIREEICRPAHPALSRAILQEEERQARWMWGFNADWFMPPHLVRRWRSLCYPTIPTLEAVRQWRGWLTRMQTCYLGEFANLKNADTIEAEIEHDLELIRQALPDLLDDPPAATQRTDPVTARLEALKRKQQQEEAQQRKATARSQRLEEFLWAPSRRWRECWNATWENLLVELARPNGIGICDAGKHLSQIGELIRQTDELCRTADGLIPRLDDRGIPIPTASERLDLLARAEKGFRSSGASLAAALLCNAFEGQSPTALAVSLRGMIQDEATKDVLGWFPFFRDAVFTPLDYQQTPPHECRKATPEGQHHGSDRLNAIMYMLEWPPEWGLLHPPSSNGQNDSPCERMRGVVEQIETVMSMRYPQSEERTDWQALVDLAWSQWRGIMPKDDPPPDQPENCNCYRDAERAVEALRRELREIERRQPLATPATEAAPIPASVEKGKGGAPTDKPDGPFGADGFRFAGVEVRFGRAPKQYRLVKALWNAKANRLAEPRPIEDVKDEVWGEGNDTEDTAFRQLCSDTRKKLQTANCPLDIEALNGVAWLVPL